MEGKASLEYEWSYTSKEIVSPEEFLRRINTKLSQKKILSVGEHHDLNKDNSYGWINDFAGEILFAYKWYQAGKATGKETPPLVELLGSRSDRLEKLINDKPSIVELQQMHVSRLFALGILPVARAVGYTDIVLEGFDEKNPGKTIGRSTDRTGDLLKMVFSMMLGMRIHGAWPDSSMHTPKDTGDSLLKKIKDVKTKNPTARIIVYNGAIHNMTEAFRSGSVVSSDLRRLDASEWTYAPRAIEMWGNRYGAIDLLNGNSPLPESHYKYMQKDALSNAITCYTHGIDQQSYVFK